MKKAAGIIGRSRRARWSVGAMLMLTGCAGPVYLHSPSLEKATAASADAMPDAATALKPFDDQLANLNAFAARENLGVAGYWTATRDGDIARILAQRDPTVQRRQLTVSVNRRLQTLAGSAVASGGRSWLELAALARNARLAADARAHIDIYIESFTRQYRDLEVAEHPHDLRCATVLAEVPEADRDRPQAAANDLERALRNLAAGAPIAPRATRSRAISSDISRPLSARLRPRSATRRSRKRSRPMRSRLMIPTSRTALSAQRHCRPRLSSPRSSLLKKQARYGWKLSARRWRISGRQRRWRPSLPGSMPWTTPSTHG